MQLRALEDEVSALSAEMTRLRLMVQQCTDREQRQASLAAENERLKSALLEAQQAAAANGHHRQSHKPLTSVAATGTLDGLPPMFSGADGTARLFKAIMDAYPWLVPADVQEAQDIVRQERDLQAEERRQRHARRAQRQQLELDAEREESLQDRLAVAQRAAVAQPQYRMPQNAHTQALPPLSAVSSTNLVPLRTSDDIPPISPRPLGTPLHNTQGSLFDRPSTPAVAAADAWAAVDAGHPPPSVGSQSQSSSPTNAPAAASGVAVKSQAMAGTGVVLGSRPGAKKSIPSLVMKWKQGNAAGDSDDDHSYEGNQNAMRSITPPVKDVTRMPADADDDHDF